MSYSEKEETGSVAETINLVSFTNFLSNHAKG